MAARPIPEGFHSVTAHLTVRDAVKMIEFYKKAFGAREVEVKRMPDGRVMHAKIKIGDTFVMLNDEFPEMGGPCPSASPLALNGVSCTLNLYVEDADKQYSRTSLFWQGGNRHFTGYNAVLRKSCCGICS